MKWNTSTDQHTHIKKNESKWTWLVFLHFLVDRWRGCTVRPIALSANLFPSLQTQMHMVLQQEASSHSHLLIYVGIHHIDWSKASIFNEKFDCRCVCVLVVCVGAKRWRRLEGRKSCRRSNSSNFKHWHSFFFLFNYYSSFTFLLESFAFLPFCCCAHSVHSRDMFRTSGMREMMKTVE